MFKDFEFALPTRGTKVPDGPDWLHEIKYDGFRLLVQREDDRVRTTTVISMVGKASAPASWALIGMRITIPSYT